MQNAKRSATKIKGGKISRRFRIKEDEINRRKRA